VSRITRKTPNKISFNGQFQLNYEKKTFPLWQIFYKLTTTTTTNNHEIKGLIDDLVHVSTGHYWKWKGMSHLISHRFFSTVWVFFEIDMCVVLFISSSAMIICILPIVPTE